MLVGECVFKQQLLKYVLIASVIVNFHVSGSESISQNKTVKRNKGKNDYDELMKDQQTNSRIEYKHNFTCK